MSKMVVVEQIERKIYFVRGMKVMLDKDLAQLYGVLTKNLNKAVTRNVDRFPSDFMIRLTKKEYGSLRFQFGTLKKGAHSKYLPYVFTEQGVAMLSSVLRSQRAIHDDPTEGKAKALHRVSSVAPNNLLRNGL